MFEVSRSGYYAWRERAGKEDRCAWLEALIIRCRQLSSQTYGIGRVKRLLENTQHIHVNHKAILRILRKLELLAQARRRRPYTHYKQAVFKYPNLLWRAFVQPNPIGFG